MCAILLNESCASWVRYIAGDAGRLRRPASPYSGNARVNARITADKFDSAPPVVKLAAVAAGRPNFPASQASVWRSISFAAGDVRHVASCGLYIATSVSAITDARVTLGLKSPKYRG